MQDLPTNTNKHGAQQRYVIRPVLPLLHHFSSLMPVSRSALWGDIGLYVLALFFPPIPVLVRKGFMSRDFGFVLLPWAASLLLMMLFIIHDPTAIPLLPLRVAVNMLLLVSLLFSLYTVWTTLQVTGLYTRIASDVENQQEQQPPHSAPADSKIPINP